MFNGIIHNTGTVKSIKRFQNSILIGIQNKFKIKKKDIVIFLMKLLKDQISKS